MRLFYHLVAAAMVCLLPSAAAAQQLSNPSMTVYPGIQQPEMLHLNESGQAVGYHYYFYVLYGDEVIGFVWQKQKWVNQSGNHRRRTSGSRADSSMLSRDTSGTSRTSSESRMTVVSSALFATRSTTSTPYNTSSTTPTTSPSSSWTMNRRHRVEKRVSEAVMAVSPNGIAVGFAEREVSFRC